MQLADNFKEATTQLEIFSTTGRFKKSSVVQPALIRKGTRCRKPPNRFTPNESSTSDEDPSASQLQNDLNTSTDSDQVLAEPPLEPEILSSIRKPATTGYNKQANQSKRNNANSSSQRKRPAKRKTFT